MSEAFSLTAWVKQRVDQADDGRFVVALEQVGGLGYVLGQMREVGIVVQALEHLHRGAGARFVGDAQHGIEGLDRHALELQGNADEAAHFRQGFAASRQAGIPCRPPHRRCRAPRCRGASRTETTACAAVRRLAVRRSWRRRCGGGVRGRRRGRCGCERSGSGVVNGVGGLGVAPCGFVSDGGGAGSAIPDGIAGTAGCFWPGNSVMWPPFRVR